MVKAQILKNNDLDALEGDINAFLDRRNIEFISATMTQDDRWYTVLIMYNYVTI